MIIINDILTLKFFGNTIESYLWAFGTLIVSILIIQFIKKVILKSIFKRLHAKSFLADTELIPTIKKYFPRFLYGVALYASIMVVDLSEGVNHVINLVFLAISVYYSTKIAIAVIDFFFYLYRAKKSTEADQMRAMSWISKIIKAVMWTIAFLLVLSNIVPDISALVAGLGVGGIAVAFAAQEILADIFSYFTIFFDRPYEIGDFIATGGYMGNVEYIGVRTTRLRSLSGEELIFSNKDLTTARLQNYKSLKERRVVFNIGLTYDTPVDKLRALPEVFKTIIESQEKTRFGRAHFLAYGDSSLKYEIVYFVLTDDYNLYMDIQQEINLQLKAQFEAMNLEFAFPTRTLYIENQVEPRFT